MLKFGITVLLILSVVATRTAAESFQGDPLKAAWLPNEAIARTWMEYVKDTAVKDTTPPPGPTNVRVLGNEVAWEAEADLESGLAHFLIERDGQFFASVPGEGKNPFGRPIFQNLQYSDTPTQPLMEMRYTDEHAESGKTHSYRVVAVNTVDLKSKATGELPKVVLIGDSIRLSYAATVIKHLNGKALVISPKANGGDSSNVLKNLDQWVIGEKPSVVHFNCGIHDTKKLIATGKFQASPVNGFVSPFQGWPVSVVRVVSVMSFAVSRAIVQPVVDFLGCLFLTSPLERLAALVPLRLPLDRFVIKGKDGITHLGLKTRWLEMA